MPHAASITITPSTAGPVAAGASGTKAKASVGSAKDGTFGALFREKAANVEEATAGSPKAQKVKLQAPVQQRNVPDLNVMGVAEKTAGTSAVLNSNLVQAASAKPKAWETAQAGAAGSAMDAHAGFDAATAKPATEAAKDLTATAVRRLAETGPSELDPRSSAVSISKAKPGDKASSSAGTDSKRKSKEVVTAGVSGVAGAISQGVVTIASMGVVAPSTSSAGKALARVAVSAEASGQSGTATQQSGSAVVGAGQSAVQKPSPSMMQVGDAAAMQPLSVTTTDTSIGQHASELGNAPLEGHAVAVTMLHAGHATTGHEALDRSMGANMLSEAGAIAGAANAVSTQHEVHAGAERAALPMAAQSAAVSMHAVSSGPVAVPNASPFDRIDQAASPVVLHAGVQHVEVGVHDPQLGWVEISAQSAAGHVDARLVAASGQTHSVLAAQLPAIAQFMQERDVRVGTLVVHHPAAQTGTGRGQTGGQPGSHAGSGGGGTQHFRGGGSGGTTNVTPMAQTGRPPEASTQYATESTALGPVSYISVRA